MNETSNTPDPVVVAAPAAETPNAAAPQPEPSLLETVQQPQTLLVGIVVLAILLAGQTWSSHNQVRSLREEMARRLQKGDASNAETGALVRAVQESSKELQAKVSLLESKQQEAQS